MGDETLHKEFEYLKEEIRELKAEFRILSAKIPPFEDAIVTKQKVGTLQSKVDKMVTRAEFAPIKLIIYGLVGIVLTSVGGALVTLILK